MKKRGVRGGYTYIMDVIFSPFGKSNFDDGRRKMRNPDFTREQLWDYINGKREFTKEQHHWLKHLDDKYRASCKEHGIVPVPLPKAWQVDEA